MLKIGICVKNLTSGGTEKQAVMLANALVTNHRVTFIILNGDKVNDKYLNMLDNQVIVKSFLGKKSGRVAWYRQCIKETSLDIIFSYLTAANYYSVMAARGTNTRVVTGIRNSKLPLLKHIADALLSRCGSVASVCNCESGKRHFASTGFKKSKIEVIPNCFYPIDESVERGERDTVRVITVGRFVAQKDYRTAIKAVAEASGNCKELRFTIIGYGALEEQIRAWVRKEGIEDITRILIDSDNIADELRQADIYMSTSIFEGISNSIMEGMNADMPIVATRVGDNDKLVEHNENGYLASVGDYKALGRYIEMLAGNAELRREMGAKSKKMLKAKFSNGLFAQRYNDLITKIVGR